MVSLAASTAAKSFVGGSTQKKNPRRNKESHKGSNNRFTLHSCSFMSYGKKKQNILVFSLCDGLTLPSFEASYPSAPARWLQVGADGLHHRGVPAAAGAPLCSRVSGVALLQSHGGENARLDKCNANKQRETRTQQQKNATQKLICGICHELCPQGSAKV